MKALGDFIGGRFVAPAGESLRSVSPAEGATVLETEWDPARASEAAQAAAEALPGWRARSLGDRVEALHRFRESLAAAREPLAEAITREMGKLRSESRAEVDALVSRFEIVERRIAEDMQEGPVRGHPREVLRYQPLGVVGVIGPFNFPLHLCHAHVVPALLLGNTVVVKTSEVAPLAGQRYAEAALAAGLPPGVLNLVQGRGATGAALVASPHLRALAFTGSWATGRRILETTLDRPEVLVALEMGGKNTSVVCEDADVRQAAHEIAVGGYLTTGQRCTCTDRVLVHERLRDRLVEALARIVGALRMGDPDDPASFAGPLATLAQKERFLEAVAAGERGGAERVASGAAPEAHAFVAPSLHVLPRGAHDIAGYTDAELFGPDVHVESFSDDDEAIAVLNASHVGLANSVFTAERARFERYLRETSCGVMNWNRSTNQASPRLPFGGTGRSGNYRPAGAWAPRNLAHPVAVHEKLLGELDPNERIAALLPPPDLDALEARHVAEEREEAARTLVDEPRPLDVSLPRGGKLPRSEHWLDRLYAGDRMVREKKPGVFDHLRSAGPWFVSVDDEPLSVIDGMTQTATLCAGFAEAPVVRAFVENGFGDTILYADDTSLGGVPAAEEFAARLRQVLPGLPFVSFVNSGAEACEKALALCRQRARSDKQRKVLAFEGSFHGRTLLALHASYNPAKRAPFEIAGHEVTFAPFPVWWEPHTPEPAAPEAFYATVARGRMDEARDRWGASAEGLLASEVRALVAVHEALSAGDHFAVIVEPMQSEGGDRYATARFFRALRLLTRHHGVPLVIDEVQTGFGLGGTFAWHTRFNLIARDGNPDGPDCVTFAKRAQAGVVMSRFEDPEPTSAHPASLVRGRIHAEMTADDPRAKRTEDRVRRRLVRLSRRFPDLVGHPRATGYAFAFDLPTASHLNAYLGQRFWRGAIVFGAGSRTVRYRLNASFTQKQVDRLFDAIRRSLSWLDAHPGQMPPGWEDLRKPVLEAREVAEEREAPEIRFREAPPEEAEKQLEAILLMEERVYEPARRDSPERLRMAFEDPDGIAVIAEVRDGDEWTLVGCALGVPIERMRETGGPDRDPMLGADNTLYSLALTVDPGYRGFGIGRELKHALTLAARARRRPDGSARYFHVAGRNRVGKTDAMMRVNESLGAYELYRLKGVYDDPEAQAVYYRHPTGPFVVDPTLRDGQQRPERPLDLAGGIARPFAAAPESLSRALEDGLLYGPTVNKITICNYVTPAIVRAVEHVGALLPQLSHLYIASSRDETFDKCVRMLRWHRKEGQVVLGLAGGYLGHTSAAARSLSDPAVHRQGAGYFGSFRRVPHPDAAGTEAVIEALDAAIAEAGGAERVIGLFVEPMQERTGRVLPSAFDAALAAWRARTEVPVVLVETGTASYRSGMGAFAMQGGSFVPDAVTWWGGGQIGFIHTSRAWFVPNPLTLVSTWDGDELSLVRVDHQLRAGRELDLSPRIAALDEALVPLGQAGLTARGLGLHRVVEAPGRASAIAEALLARGIRVRAYPNDHLGIAPPLDVELGQLERLGAALREVIA